MKESYKIHILTQELIPVFDELEQNTKDVVTEHIQECVACQQLYNEIAEGYFPSQQCDDVTKIKPLNKLVQFNRSLKWLFIFIRVFILCCILYSAFHFYNWEVSSDAAIAYIKSTTFMLYFPAVIFLTVFTMVFLNKRWIIFSILFDLGIVLFLDTFISIFYV